MCPPPPPPALMLMIIPTPVTVGDGCRGTACYFRSSSRGSSRFLVQSVMLYKTSFVLFRIRQPEINDWWFESACASFDGRCVCVWVRPRGKSDNFYNSLFIARLLGSKGKKGVKKQQKNKKNPFAFANIGNRSRVVCLAILPVRTRVCVPDVLESIKPGWTAAGGN